MGMALFFTRVMSQAAMLAWTFSEYRDNEENMQSVFFEVDVQNRVTT